MWVRPNEVCMNERLYFFPGFAFVRPDDEEKLADDYELQAWGLELVADGNPGCGIKVSCKLTVN